jgi:glycosyltransferase involved in cell wall biosynthesis
MNILFVHQNFPGQFRHVAAHLARRPEHRVAAIGAGTAREVPGVTLLRYGLTVPNLQAVHPFARRFEIECRRAEQIVYVASELAASGFVPEVVVVHCGWGESLPLKALFPDARIVTYCEFYYRPEGLDVGFDREWDDLSLDAVVALRSRNAATLLAMAEADLCITPTRFQRSTFPAVLHPAMEVCHEGVDVVAVRPDPRASLTLPGGVTVTAGDEVVTFVARNLEPLRGYHVFMRALPQVLRERPGARVLIVGADGVSYGASAPAGRSWRDLFLDEVRGAIDGDRVHFLGRLAYADYLRVLQVSAAPVYLTYPFVLSWSMLEAMAAGCLVIGSATGPVEEVIDGRNGVLVDFFDRAALADAVVAALARPAAFAPLRARARDTVVERFALRDCIDRMTMLIGAGPG